MTSLKQKTISGFKWSFLETFSRFFLSFFISIILARLLSPTDYGLIGMTVIFMSLARVFIDAGFSDALIRKINPSQEEYSSIFYFNFFLAILLFLALYFGAKPISVFFNEPNLISIIRIGAIGLPISAAALIHTIILRKKMDFKLQTKISVYTALLSGVVSITMAFIGFGVWSLVTSGILSAIASTSLLWYYNDWRSLRVFKLKIIKEHFSFGSKIMAGSFIHVVYNNMNYVLIGRLFTPAELGFYHKANMFQKLPAENLDTIVRQVTYPALASIQNEQQRLKNVYRTLIKTTSFVVFTLLLGLSAVAEPMIIILIGEKWLPSVPLLQLLCFVGVFFPLISININVLNVKGRSDLSLQIMALKLILLMPSLVLGYLVGVKAMILGMVGSFLIVYFIVIFFTANQIDYTVKEQLSDIWPALIIGVLVSFPLFIFGYILTASPFLIFPGQIIIGSILLAFWGTLLKNEEFKFFKTILKERLSLSKKEIEK